MKQGLSFQIWPSSLTLVRYAEERQRLQRGCWKVWSIFSSATELRPTCGMLRSWWTSVGIASQASHVLEIGCGCGLVGLVLASLGAHVALTDLPQTMVFLGCII